MDPSSVETTVPLLVVSDIERSMRFYRDGVGFSVERHWAPDGHVAWCWLSLGGASIMLQQAEPGDRPGAGGITLYLLCADADEVHAELVRRGTEAAAPEVAFYGMKQVHLRDPDGYALCFESPVDAA